MRTLFTCVLLLLFNMPNSYAGQSGKLMAGYFLMCDTASQVAHYLTLIHLEGKSGLEAREAGGKNEKGHKVCGTGHWLYFLVSEHSKFNVGNANYVINEIVVVGYVLNGVGKPGVPIKQFGFGRVRPSAKAVGYRI